MNVFEVERAPLVNEEAPAQQGSLKKKILAGTAVAVSVAVVLAVVVAFAGSGSSWVNDKTPNALLTLTAINGFTDMKPREVNAVTQANQIKYRADSFAALPKDSAFFSNIAPVLTEMQKLSSSDELSAEEKKYAEELVKMMTKYQEIRKEQTAFNMSTARVADKEVLLREVQSWLNADWVSAASEMEFDPAVQTMDFKEEAVDLAAKLPSKLCSELAWYSRWWNTIKGWFGSKPSNCLPDEEEIFLLSSQQPGKSWWNSMGDWFKSMWKKTKNLVGAGDDKKPVVAVPGQQGPPAEKFVYLATGVKPASQADWTDQTANWFKNNWSSFQNWFCKSTGSCGAKKGGKVNLQGATVTPVATVTSAPAGLANTPAPAQPTTPVPAPAKKPVKAAKLAPLCSSLAWYSRWWNTFTGWFGSKSSCRNKLISLTACKSLPWYKRWWNTIKGWFGSKPTNCNIAIDLKSLPACKSLAWYSRWWNTIKGWFGSKPSNCKLFLDLASVPTKLCSELPWYSRWWNTIKGWFGSKPSNCLPDKFNLLNLGSGSSKKCSDLPWYSRWWNTIKGWFGSKPTNCVKVSIFIDDAREAEEFVELKPACSQLPWYSRWWNTIKGWFGSARTNCVEGVVVEEESTERAGRILAEKMLEAPKETVAEVPAVVEAAEVKPEEKDTELFDLKKSLENVGAEILKKKVEHEAKSMLGLLPDCKTLPWYDFWTDCEDKDKLEVDLGSKLCKDRAWYQRWWDTIKGWFGSKASCVKLDAEEVDLGSKLCKDRAWYQRWWDTIKGWFGSKASCTKLQEVDLGSKLCKDRAWYQRWWDTIKGWFGSKAGCIKDEVEIVPMINMATKLCKDRAWYQRWWDTIKGWFGSKANCLKEMESDLEEMFYSLSAEVPKNRFQKDAELTAMPSCAQALYMRDWDKKPMTCLDAEEGVVLATLKKCSDLAWYSRWWNTIKGWFGSKATNCHNRLALENVSTAFNLAALPTCKSLAWYSRWWNTIKGWFGSKPSNCVAQLSIYAENENDATLQALLASDEADEIRVHVEEPTSKKVGLDNFELLNEVATVYTRAQNEVDLGLVEVPKNHYETFFQTVAEVFRNKGLPMELYETPVATDLIEKLPSFTDSKPVNGFVKMMDTFAKAKTVILAQDKIDRSFLDYIERYLMALAYGAKSSTTDIIAKHANLSGFMDNAKLN